MTPPNLATHTSVPQAMGFCTGPMHFVGWFTLHFLKLVTHPIMAVLARDSDMEDARPQP